MNSLSLSKGEDATSAASRRRRLARLSAIASWISFAAALAIAVAALYSWLITGELSGQMVRSIDGIVVPPSQGAVTAAGAVAMAPIALLVALLVEVGRLFRLFAAGRLFDPAVPRRLVSVGWLAFSGCAAAVVSKTLVTLLLTSSNPPGHHILTIGFDVQALTSLIVGFLLLVFSLVMQEALGLAEENRSFV